MIDDATSDIPAAEFWPTETTAGCLAVLCELIEKRGKPWFIFTDKAGVYGGQKRQEFSHFDQACKELGISVIYADSAEAKGRVERFFRTMQDRLVAEMRLAGVTNLAEGRGKRSPSVIHIFRRAAKSCEANCEPIGERKFARMPSKGV
jgi:hypothetical protein